MKGVTEIRGSFFRRLESAGPCGKQNREITAIDHAVAVDVGVAVRSAPRREKQGEIGAVDESITVDITWIASCLTGICGAVFIDVIAGASDSTPGGTDLRAFVLGQFKAETSGEATGPHRLRTEDVETGRSVTDENTSERRRILGCQSIETTSVRQTDRTTWKTDLIRTRNTRYAG